MSVNRIIYILVAMVVIFLFDYILMGNTSIGGFSRYRVYVPVLYLVELLILALIIFQKNKILKFLSFVFIFTTYTINYSFLLISGTGFNRYEALLSLDQISFANEALSTYYPQITKASIVVFLFVVVLYYLTKKSKLELPSKYTFLPFILLLIFLSVKIKSGTITKLFPIPYQLTCSIVYALSDKQFFGKREKVTRTVSKKSQFDKIIFLMDESVRGDFISLNNNDENTTPFLVKVKNKIFNYGIASSAVNCSTGSNIIVQSGLKETMLPDKEQHSLKDANIFQYMKKAGYTTVFIDGQNETDRPIHAMSRYDFENIDHYYQIRKEYPNVKPAYVDMLIADKLKDIIVHYDKVFVYVNKTGAHFNYEHSYPEKEEIYRPHMQIGKPNFDRDEMINSYRNAIHWSVNEFFKKLFYEFNKKDVLVLYTSDHGQNLLDDGKSRTHCSRDPLSYEAEAPLLVIPFGKYYDIYKEKYGNSTVTNYNKLSHFNIFPTLLFFAGYSLENGEKTFFDKQKDDRHFYFGDIWGRTYLGKKVFQITH